MYGDRTLSVISEAAGPEIHFTKPELSEQTAILWDKFGLKPFTAKPVIPLVHGQPDWLREAQRDRLLHERETNIDMLLNKVEERPPVPPTQEELKQLLLDAAVSDATAVSVN